MPLNNTYIYKCICSCFVLPYAMNLIYLSHTDTETKGKMADSDSESERLALAAADMIYERLPSQPI